MKYRILIVEDQPEIRRLVRMTLEMEDHEIHEASDGETGLHLAEVVEPHAVLLDVMMPGAIDGFQLCQRLRADPRFAAVPIFMLSARGQSEDLDLAERSGATGYFVKPFSPLELIERLERTLPAAA